MHFSKETVARARAELARRREDRTSRNAAMEEQLYRQIPQLRQIDIQLRGTMALAAQAIFSQGADMTAAMDKARQENLALQEKRRALILAHFPDGEPEPQSGCPHCGDTGYIGSTMCSCLQELCLQEHRRELGTAFQGGERFENFRLEYYSDRPLPQIGASPRSVMEKNLKYCREYARFFARGAGNLMLTGGTGLGKTHLALSIGSAVGEQGYQVCYETAISLFSKLEKARFSRSPEAEEQARRLEECDLLILDDLGTEMPGQFVTAALYGLLNQRLMAGRAMVITTNLNVDETAQRYSPQIASRLYGEFRRLTFVGSDIRVLKNGGQV